MKIRCRILVLVLIFAVKLMYAQVKFTALPSDLELVPRDTDSSGSVIVAGKCWYASYQVHSSLVALSSQNVVEDVVTSLNPDSTFIFKHQVPARMEEYELRIYLKNSFNEFLIKTVKRLVSGDCFIIAGQSNASAASDVNQGGDQQFKLYSKPWLRGIGTHQDPLLPSYPCVPQSFGFYQANSNWKEMGFVGTWGLKLQADLATQTGIPNCIINGAEPGSSLRQNLASQTPSDPLALDSCNFYDRLYNKVTHHRLNKAVKLLFWYQGETDANLPLAGTCSYVNGFDSLYRSWKLDYPNIQKIILLQVNTGCNDNHVAQLREIQRRIASRYSDVSIVPTFSKDSSDRTPDQCHYTLAGYNKIADRLLPIVKKIIYKSITDEQAIFPPAILKAYSFGPGQLCLEFDRAIAVQQSVTYLRPTARIAYIKDYFYGEHFLPLHVEQVSSAGSKLYLNFAPGADVPKKITYLPHSYTNIPTLYTGPWILNAINPDLPALSFFDFPVSDSLDNGWQKAWTNFEDGNLGSHILKDKELFYPGNFNGEGGDELLCLSYNESLGTMSISLLRFENGKWLKGVTPVINSKAMFKDAHRIIVNDFDGDGKDELLVNGDQEKGEAAILLKYEAGAWLQVWSDAPSPVLKNYRAKLYGGDFNGDGKAELIGFTETSPGLMAEFQFNGSDFVKDTWSSDLSTALVACKDQIWPADYNGDGTTDLLGFAADGNQLLFLKHQGTWKIHPVNNLVGAAGNLDTIKAIHRVVLAGNIDSDLRDELMVMHDSRRSSVGFLDLRTLNEHVSSWRLNHNISSGQFINDWPVDTLGGAIYLLMKVRAGEPKQLLCLRKESCGYLASLYKFNGDTSLAARHDVDPRFEETGFFIRPNPSSGAVTLYLSAKNANLVTVFDLQGRQLLQLENQLRTISLDLGFLERGLYVIQVSNSQHTSAKKLVIER